MFFFLCGILIVVFGGYILISLIQLVFMIIGGLSKPYSVCLNKSAYKETYIVC